MALSTTGAKAAVSLGVVLPRKYSVAALSPSLHTLRTSSKVISVTASPKIPRAAGAARSAARFMESTSSSTLSP
jgi:hypothetical protein